MLTEAGHRVEYDFWGKRGKVHARSLLTRRVRVVGIMVDHRDETRAGQGKGGQVGVGEAETAGKKGEFRRGRWEKRVEEGRRQVGSVALSCFPIHLVEY